ncbi:MAG: hypothetical protein IPI30_23685 [Saprospiraceae bacterium]|nr:hypothetical protein [Candidatus Vicinibacter affinis]MBK7697191.1 hypothetical protein [Candidatus Vicinibacter affinis]
MPESFIVRGESRLRSSTACLNSSPEAFNKLEGERIPAEEAANNLNMVRLCMNGGLVDCEQI